MGKIISVANQKGGVGKTTTTVNLGACLGALGKKVLIIDADPQGNSTSGFGIDKNKCEYNLYNVLIEKTNIKSCIQVTQFKNVSICPCNMDLLGAELLIDKEDNKEYILKEALNTVKNEYDFIIMLTHINGQTRYILQTVIPHQSRQFMIVCCKQCSWLHIV